jgi:hypothetical protein
MYVTLGPSNLVVLIRLRGMRLRINGANALKETEVVNRNAIFYHYICQDTFSPPQTNRSFALFVLAHSTKFIVLRAP